MDVGDLLEFGSELAIKEFVRRELISAGVDIDNWRRKSASVLCGGIGTLAGGLLGGPLGLLCGAMLSTYAQSIRYVGDRSPEEVKHHYREAARMKALERCMQVIANDAPSHLHSKFRQAFHDAHGTLSRTHTSLDSHAVENVAREVLYSVDYETGRKFDRLYSTAKELIG